MHVDLHMHTTASDGDLTPTELVALVRRRGLDVIAITDHDTTDGVFYAITQNVVESPLTIIPAIELGAEDHGLIDMLGYYIDPAAAQPNSPFQAWLKELREDRLHRGQRMVNLLVEIGVPITWDRVLAIAKGAAVARPHVARALVEAGHAESLKDAFNRYIGEGGPGYVARKRLLPEEAIERLHSVGACAVLAHPARVKNYSALVERLVPAGLDGIEMVHPDNDETVRLNVRGLAAQHGLLMTGGSDFHRPNTDGTLNLGAYNPPDGTVQALWERAQRYRAP